MKTVRVVISGRVQGVWYRAWTQKQAIALGLAGWVRNRADGSVEAVFSGPEKQVDDMLAKCKKGPPLARVDSIVLEPTDAPSDESFQTLSTV